MNQRLPMIPFPKNPWRVGGLIASLLLLSNLSVLAQAAYTLDFRNSYNLKVLFDSGLRPWRLPGLEKSEITFRDVNIILIAPDGEPFLMPVTDGSFSVRTGNKLTHGGLMGKITSLAEATALTKRICAALHIPTESLDKVLADFNPENDWPNRWGEHIQSGNLEIYVNLDLITFFDRSVGSKVNVNLSWRTPSFMYKTPSGPIQPPPEYAGVWMEEPPRRSNPYPVPQRSFESYVEEGKKIFAEQLRQQQQGPKPAEEPMAAPSTTPLPQAVP